MSVKAILNVKGRRVVTIRRDALVKEAVAMLAHERIGAVVVTDDGGKTIAGILSERDVIHALDEHGARLLDLKVGDLMTEAVTAAKIDMHIDQVLEIMTQGRFRHMPVIEEGHLAGIVSIGDAVKARLEMLESEASQLKEYIFAR
ncbi:MAG TPA: CBS domain-containing protein [Alphaproteobacteria bacterium]|nr:CBS domain-containing protein [Alphaproteobacteria bacterium]